jgi:5-methylcytosine-specific restriction endonuclease McrA
MFRAFIQSVVAYVQGRSSQWPRTRATWLIDHPTCAACGGTEGLNVHHVFPVYVYPERELDPHNLITLCEKRNCHFIWGHLNKSWKTWNRTVVEDAAAWLAKVKKAPVTSKCYPP